MNRHFLRSAWLASLLVVAGDTSVAGRETNVVVYSTVTPTGKEVGPASAEEPQYYVLINRGYQRVGPSDRDLPPPANAMVERQVRKALEQRHYYPAPKDGSRIDLYIILFWGALFKESVPGYFAMGTIVQRTASADQYGMMGDPFAEMILNEREFVMLLTGGTLQDMHPWDFNRRDLVHQMRKNRYFVTVQAYAAGDFRADMTRAQKLWQTQMSVDQTGMNLTDSIPSLLTAGRRYFGESTRFGRIQRAPVGHYARVEIGDLDVIEEQRVSD